MVCAVFWDRPVRLALPNLNMFRSFADKDPAPQFIHPDTQKMLKSITRIDLDKIYRKRLIRRSEIEYKFMTTEQIESEFRHAVKKAHRFLQMPPVIKVSHVNTIKNLQLLKRLSVKRLQMQDNTLNILTKEPALTQFDASSYIFTDITYGISDKHRSIVVRHPDGTLENAKSDVRKRMNTIYFPLGGRKLRTPRMFTDADCLKRCLDHQQYIFVLDRMCIQFEPYEPEFHGISSQCYMHINEAGQFDTLRSTRHFGPMAFFLAWHRIIDNLLIDMIERDYLHNAVELLCLHYRLNGVEYDATLMERLSSLRSGDTDNPLEMTRKMKLFDTTSSSCLQQELDSRIGKTDEQFQAIDIALETIEQFSRSHALKKSKIDASLQAYRQMNEEKRQLYIGLQKAHGVS